MFIVKLLGQRDIESCGYIAHSYKEVESYCSGVEYNMSQYIYKISVYECPDQEVEARYLFRHGFDLMPKDLKLIKELCVGMNPKYKRGHIQ